MQARFLSPLGTLRFWLARNTAGALMAKATYEPLEDGERSRLDYLCEKYRNEIYRNKNDKPF